MTKKLPAEKKTQTFKNLKVGARFSLSQAITLEYMKIPSCTPEPSTGYTAVNTVCLNTGNVAWIGETTICYLL